MDIIENSALWVLIPTVERGREQKYLCRTATSGSLHSAPAGGATYQGTVGYIKNVPSHQELGHVPPGGSAMADSHTDYVAGLFAAEECSVK